MAWVRESFSCRISGLSSTSKDWIDRTQRDDDSGVTTFDRHREEQHANGTTHTAGQRAQDACCRWGSRETLPGVGADDHHKAGACREKGKRGGAARHGWH